MASTSDEVLAAAGVTSGEAQSPPSDNDGGERPVRKQLKETSIESASRDDHPDPSANENGNGRKRSFEESRDDAYEPNENGDGSRKRSRECTPEDSKVPESATGKNTSAGAPSENVSEIDHPKAPASTTPLDTLDTPKETSQTGTPSPELESEDPQDLFVKSEDPEEFSLESVSAAARDPNIQNSDGLIEVITISDDEFVSSSEPDETSPYFMPPAANQSIIKDSSVIEIITISDDESVATSEPEELPVLDDELDPPEENSSEISSDTERMNRFLRKYSYIPSSMNSGFDMDSHGYDSDGRPLSGDEESVSGDEQSASGDEEPASGDEKSVSGDEESVPAAEDTPSPHPKDPKDLDTESEKNDDTNDRPQDTAQPTIEGASGTGADDTKAPKKKRSREQLEECAKKPEASVAPPQTKGPEGQPAAEGEPEKKRHRDNSQERDAKTASAFAASAFAGASASSPFASLGKNLAGKSENASTSAFAASSMAAFAGTEKSPFGALGAATTSSVFQPTTSGTSSFGSTAGTSGFGTLGSGFSGVGGGFAAAKPGGLTSFVSPNAPAAFGEKAKPLGAEESEAEDSNADDDGDDNDTFEAEKTDERFFEQTIETGEEEEENVFSCKAKLFHFSKEWKERGIGTFKVNLRKNAQGKQTGRMIMRADGAGRVMLNSPIFKGMNYGDAKNEAPSSKQILLASTEEGRTVPLLLRTGNEAYAKELYEIIDDLLNPE